MLTTLYVCVTRRLLYSQPYMTETSRQVAGSIVNCIFVCKQIPPASGHPLYPLPQVLIRSWRSLPPLTSKPLAHSPVTFCAQEVRRILATGINPDKERDEVSVVVIIEARVLGLWLHTWSGGVLWLLSVCQRRWQEWCMGCCEKVVKRQRPRG